MLTESEWKDIRAGMKFLGSSRCVPFDWDSERDVLLPSTSPAKIVAAFMTTLVTFVYSVINFARLPSAYYNVDKGMGDLAMHIVCANWYLTMFIWKYSICFENRHEFANLFNQQMQFNAAQGKKHIGRSFERPMKRSFMFRFGGSMNWSTCIVWAFVFVTQRDQYFFVYSAFPDAWKTPAVLILMTVFEVFFSTQWLISCYVVFFAQYQYLISSKFWLQKICMQWPKSFVEFDNCWNGPSHDQAFNLYRSVELMNSTFNNCFSSIIIPQLKALSIMASAFLFFAAIKYGDSMQPALRIMVISCGFFYLSILVYMCHVGAYFHECTKLFRSNYGEVIRTMPTGMRQFYGKTAKACVPFGFRVGGFYVIVKRTIETAMEMMVNSVLYLLLSY